MRCRVGDVMQAMERIAPACYAGEGDPNGLHAGHPADPVRRVLLVLDATRSVIAEAARRGAGLIVAHHPRFYRPLRNLDRRTHAGRIGMDLASRRLALFCAHTNLDTAPGGINDVLAGIAGIEGPEPLTRDIRLPLLKLVAFVPAGHETAVRRAICAAGAGWIGRYSECTFRVRGTGTFRGGKGTRPFIGKTGRLEEADEWRLETIVPALLRDEVEAALRKSHPYEEPAFDWIETACEVRTGCGRVGALQRTETLGSLARRLARACGSRATALLGESGRKIRHLAVWSGAACPVERVAASGVDAVVTGELGHHDAEILAEAGVGAVTLGHGPSEAVILRPLARKLGNLLPAMRFEVMMPSELSFRSI